MRTRISISDILLNTKDFSSVLTVWRVVRGVSYSTWEYTVLVCDGMFSLALQYFNRLIPAEYHFICIIVKHKDSLSVLKPQAKQMAVDTDWAV
jgi:hypothetical protein